MASQCREMVVHKLMGSIFEGRLIRLRAVEPTDWTFFYQWGQDTDVARLDYEIEFPRSLDQGKTWAETISRRGAMTDEFRFVIETLTGEPVGTLNTHHCAPRHGVLMYGIAVQDAYRRRGYASEAICLTLRYFFDEKRYQKVNVEIYSFNQPSIRLHERLGFVLEGRLRRLIYTRGAYHDVLVYGMTVEEFHARSNDLKSDD